MSAVDPSDQVQKRRPPWEENPYRLVSLWEIMEQVSVAEVSRISSCLTGLGRMGIYIVRDPKDLEGAKRNHALIVHELEQALKFSEGSCLDMTRMQIEPLVKNIRRQKPTDPGFPDLNFFHHMESLTQTFRNELGKRVFMYLPSERAKYYKDAPPFGEEVFDSFLSARADLVEAAKSFACARWTACVLHLTRALEVCLGILSKSVGGSTACDWDAMIKSAEKHMEIAVTGNPNQLGLDKAKRAAVQSALSHFKAIKIGWRNPAHHGEFFTEEQAKGIFESSRAFMSDMAKVFREEQGETGHAVAPS